MKMFESVAIACDQWTLDVANAIRASLELFRLRVHFDFCVQKRNVLDFLGGRIPDCDYVILCLGGWHGDEELKIRARVVDNVDGKWTNVEVAITPDSIPELVHLPGKTVVSLGCNSGRAEFARAFLDAGCRAYVAPSKTVDQDADALFAIAFFYHLLREDCDPALKRTDEEAVRLAAGADTHFKEGTHVFRYFDQTSF